MAQKINVLGIDIAKLVFHIVGMDATGHVVLRKRMARGAVAPLDRHATSSPHWHGSVWECPRLGPAVSRAWPRGVADGATICQSLREITEE